MASIENITRLQRLFNPLEIAVAPNIGHSRHQLSQDRPVLRIHKAPMGTGTRLQLLHHRVIDAPAPTLAISKRATCSNNLAPRRELPIENKARCSLAAMKNADETDPSHSQKPRLSLDQRLERYERELNEPIEQMSREPIETEQRE